MAEISKTLGNVSFVTSTPGREEQVLSNRASLLRYERKNNVVVVLINSEFISRSNSKIKSLIEFLLPYEGLLIAINIERDFIKKFENDFLEVKFLESQTTSNINQRIQYYSQLRNTSRAELEFFEREDSAPVANRNFEYVSNNLFIGLSDNISFHSS